MDSTVRIWDRENGDHLGSVAVHGDSVWSVARVGDYGAVVSVGLDGLITLIDVAGGVSVASQWCNSSSFSSSSSSSSASAAATAAAAAGGSSSSLAHPPTSPSAISRTGSQPGLPPIVSSPTSPLGPSPGHPAGSDRPPSCYAVASGGYGGLIATGCSDGVVRLWDIRSSTRVCRLKGHTDNVRACLLSEDGTRAVTGGSDGTFRLWDVGQQRCVLTLLPHSSSVFALAAVDQALTSVLSGGRDGKVFATDLTSAQSTLISKERDGAPVLALAYDAASAPGAVWVSAGDGGVRRYECGDLLVRGSARVRAASTTTSRLSYSVSAVPPARGQEELRTPLDAVAPAASVTLQCPPWLTRCRVLLDRTTVITEDSAGTLALWDAVNAARLPTPPALKQLQGLPFEEAAAKMDVEAVVPSWLSVDVRLGFLSVTLEQSKYYQAEVYGSDLGLPEKDTSALVNIGDRVIRALFATWLRRHLRTLDPVERRHYQELSRGGGGSGEGVGQDGDMAQDAEARGDGDDTPELVLPDSTVVVVSDAETGLMLGRKPIGAFDGLEGARLVPPWISDIVLKGVAPPRPENRKISFLLQADQGLPTSPFKRLTAPKVMRIMSVAAFVEAKLVALGTITQDDRVEILCMNQQTQQVSDPLPPSMSIQTAKQFRWKGSEDLTLIYRRKK